MTISTRILTFASGAQQFPAAANGIQVARIYAEPLRSNGAPAWVGTSAVTNDASGTGVIKQLSTPPAATIPVDFFDHEDQDGKNTIDPTQFYGHGTSGQKMIVTYFQR